MRPVFVDGGEVEGLKAGDLAADGDRRRTDFDAVSVKNLFQ